MNYSEIQRAVQKFLLITSRYGWKYEDLEDTYLDMPFYVITFRDGEYILPAKKERQFDEADIDYLQDRLNEFLREVAFTRHFLVEPDVKGRIQWIRKHGYPKEAHELVATLKKYPGQAYYFTDGQDVFIDLPTIQRVLKSDPEDLRLKHELMQGMDYLYYYREPDIFNLKRPDILVPLTSVDRDD